MQTIEQPLFIDPRNLFTRTDEYSHGSSPSKVPKSLSYQPSVSCSTSSILDTSQMSNCTNSVDPSFLDVGAPSPSNSMLQTQLSSVSASGEKSCPFKDCNFVGRICDMNKHIKRHQKPYGCTYPKCHNRSGSKSDWMRHEKVQHLQLKAFRCDYANNSGQICGHYCHCGTQFRKHLEEAHNITSEDYIQTDFKRCMIGENYQDQYWCGFCRQILKLKGKHQAALKERFNHIASHFEKEKLSIDDWLCVKENRTKVDLRRDTDRAVFTDENDENDDAALDGYAALQEGFL
jgi:hypothetical protein